jgi:hypothetical protein
MQVCPLLAPLFRLFKLWAKAHDLNDGTRGVFNSHCLSLLVGGASAVAAAAQHGRQ